MKNEPRDNKCVAIIAINLAIIFGVTFMAAFKVVNDEGFNPTEFVLLDCLTQLPFSIVWCLVVGYNPLKMFPWEKKWSLFWRSFTGHVNFFLFNLGASVAPISISMICFNTNTFWIAIIARIWLKEPIFLLELIGMLICFGMIAAIAL